MRHLPEDRLAIRCLTVEPFRRALEAPMLSIWSDRRHEALIPSVQIEEAWGK